MIVTTDICAWLESAPARVAEVCLNNISAEIALIESTVIHMNLARAAGINHDEMRGKAFDAALFRYKKDDKEVASILIEPKELNIAYYMFKNDDKYFMLNRDLIGYQDSSLYQGFYSHLPVVADNGTRYYADAGDLWILPRAQYGHFIYDEVIPALTSFALGFGRAPKNIHLIRSRNWQEQVVSALARKIFNTTSPIVIIHEPPLRSSVFRLSGGLIAIPSYLRTFIQAKRFLESRQVAAVIPVRRSKIYLTRKGFDAPENCRVLNNEEVREEFAVQGFDEIAPHEHTLDELFILMSEAEIIASEPGTTPLIGYLCAGPECSFMPLLSYRCMTDCSLRFSYSGWRYHIPWIPRIKKIVWGFPGSSNPNPFSDRCWYNCDWIKG